MNETTLPGFTPQPPMFEAPIAQSEPPKRRGRPPGTGRAARQPAASQVVTNSAPEASKRGRKPRKTAGAVAVTAAPKSLTELTYGVDAESAVVLEDIVATIQSLPEDGRKAVIAALQRVFP